MKNKKICFFMLILLGFFLSSVLAETIILKSGQKIEGKIIEKTDKYIKIDFQGVPIKYNNDEIEKIDNTGVSIKEADESKKQPDQTGSPAAVYQEFLATAEKANTYDEIKKYYSSDALKSVSESGKKETMEAFILGVAKETAKRKLTVVDEKILQEQAMLTLKPAVSMVTVDSANGPKEITETSFVVQMKKENGEWKVDSEEQKVSTGFVPPSGDEYQKYEKIVEGIIGAIDLQKSLVDIDGWTIKANESTVFDGASSFKDLKVGDKVKVVYYMDKDNWNIAKRFTALK